MNKSESDIRDEFFSDVVCWQSWLDVESALALAQGEIGIIPKWASKDISDNANISNIDIDFLKDEITKTGTEVFSLTRAFSSFFLISYLIKKYSVVNTIFSKKS